MLIVGGGYIAVEFACIFHGLGVDVTLVYRGSNLLRGFDEDVRAHLADELKKRGLKVALACEHERIEKREDGVLVSHVTNDQGDRDRRRDVRHRPRAAREGPRPGNGRREAERQGRGEVDELLQDQRRQHLGGGRRHRPDEPDPVAIREAQAFAETEFYDRPTAFDHDMVPTAVFSQPPVGVVGPDRGAGPPPVRQGRHLPRRASGR